MSRSLIDIEFFENSNSLLYQNTRLQLNDTIKSAIVSWDIELLKEIFSNKNVVSLSKYVLQLLDTRFPKDKEVANTKASKKTKKQRLERIEPRTFISLWQHYHNEQSCYLPQIKQKFCKQFVIHLMTEFCNYGTSIIFVNNVVECFTV